MYWYIDLRQFKLGQRSGIGMWCKSLKCIVLILLILIFPRIPIRVKKVSIAAKDAFDDEIDGILWEFIGQWDPEDHRHNIGRFKSTMTNILRLFAGIDSRKLNKLMFRIRKRMESIRRVLGEENHLKYVHSTKRKTEV